MKIQPYKGMKDYYPEDKETQNYIFNIWKNIALKYSFNEVEAPIIEPLELFTAKSGEEIKEQLYTLEDKAGRKLALRPELTPSLARMIAQRKDLIKPIKWFSIQQCFRYEREQFGRSRSFYQLNLDILGTDNLLADAELIAIAVNIMKDFGFTKNDFFIRINNRKLINNLLKIIGINNVQGIYGLIDKKSRIADKDFKEELKNLGLDDKQINELNKILSVKDIKSLEKYDVSLVEIKRVFDYLKEFGVLDYCKLDLTIVRGLDYYTSTVFEVFDKQMELRAIAGGGRYDNLVDVFGGERCPGVGFGMGDVILGLLLEKKKRLQRSSVNLDYFVAIINDKVINRSIKIAEKLRKEYKVEMELVGRSLGKQLEYASKINAKNVVIVGEKDLKLGKVTVRDMKSGRERRIKIKDLR